MAQFGSSTNLKSEFKNSPNMPDKRRRKH